MFKGRCKRTGDMSCFPWEKGVGGGKTGHSNALGFEVKKSHMHDHLGNASYIFISTDSLY